MRNIFMSAYILLLAGFLIPHSLAQNVPQNYKAFVRYADKIVRGKVSEIRRMTAYVGGEDIACGVFMAIEVVESYKGDTESYLVYNSHSDVYIDDPDTEYLIFTFKNKFYDPEGDNSDYILCEGSTSYKRNLAPFEFLTNKHTQHMFPLKKDQETGQDWMQMMDRFGYAMLPNTIEKRSVKNDNVNIIEEMPLDQFLDAFNLKN